MLPKTKRLTVASFKDGGRFVSYQTPLFDIKFKPSEKEGYAVITTTKRFKKSVERNKVRRRVYAALGELRLKSPHTVLVYPKREAKTAPYQKLLETLQSVYTDHHI